METEVNFQHPDKKISSQLRIDVYSEVSTLLTAADS